ncbi:MAG: GNAT family N-acetyltransferase [Eubacterium sp.]|nr:GNAT family N-acetyltransferase [Eubacterium sp.]
MFSQIKEIEDMSLNAWPSHQIMFYDGWLLRFSYFYTHRTNSVEQIGPSTLPLEEKVAFCEEAYRRWGTPCIFKITPLMPAAFDALLDKRGYHIEHTVTNMVCRLSGDAIDVPPSPIRPVVDSRITDAWIEALFDLKGTENVMHRRIVPSMYRSIPMETIAVSVRDKGKIIATGLGILDRNYVGVYAIHVKEEYRRQNYARSIVASILNTAGNLGAEYAYLQVVKGNEPAVRLYRSMGFEDLYTDWFRVLNLF